MTVDLNPPAYIPSEEEDLLANLELYLHEDFWELAYTFREFYEVELGAHSHKWFEDNKERMISDFLEEAEHFLSIDTSNLDWITKHSRFRIGEYLDTEHSGDCVAYPCTCMRCFAEEFYGIPYTATWSKLEGHKAIWKKYDKRSLLKRCLDRVKMYARIRKLRLQRWLKKC